MTTEEVLSVSCASEPRAAATPPQMPDAVSSAARGILGVR